MRTSFIIAACVAVLFASPGRAADSLTVHKRQRVDHPTGLFQVIETEETWNPKETVIIVCDVWDSHHCLNAVRRVMEMAPRMNQVLEKARSQGVLIIHAPSDCMATYENHPGRKIALSAPKAANLPADIHEWCRQIPAEEKGKYPIDQTDGGEDDDPAEHAKWHEYLASIGRKPKSPWKAEIDVLKIVDGDAISDKGVEIWNLLEDRKIKNVILLGVHTNMCVLGRPFGLRQMAKNGKNVVLMRDMTDTMYNPAKAPFVNHFTGTELIVQHIEKYVCPTITSTDILGGEPFRFAHDRRNIVMIIGDDEYKTEVTLPQFSASDLEPLGFNVKIIHSDGKDKNQFPGLVEAVKNADLVFVSVRRRMPPKEQLDAIRAHVAAGKPLVGIRTACHAWSLRNDEQTKKLVAAGHAEWPQFDAEVIGGNYTGHHGNDIKTMIALADGAKEHPILRGIEVSELVGNGSLYRVQPLKSTTTPLLIGAIPNQEPEPVAWTNLSGPKKARVFNTSLGHPEDFANPHFRKLLTGGIFWSLEPQYTGSPPLAAN